MRYIKNDAIVRVIWSFELQNTVYRFIFEEGSATVSTAKNTDTVKL
jgi:hypothetical protein